jgi:ABC-type nitrate/sulfonate/bicarbonate transport system permease component
MSLLIWREPISKVRNYWIRLLVLMVTLIWHIVSRSCPYKATAFPHFSATARVA